MKRLLLLTTGGTIASSEGKNGLEPGMNSEDFLNHVPGLEIPYELHTKELLNIDSTNMQPENWVQIAEAVNEAYDQYDGFVITHGTDTMAYTSAALSYMLQGSAKPIVLTGSQIPIAFEKTDAKRNIGDAIRFACEEIGGVYVVFDGRVIQGTRAIKLRTKSYDSFESINFPYVASVSQEGVEYNQNPKPTLEQTLTLDTSLCTAVVLIKLYPGIEPSLFDALKGLYKGIIIEGYGSGGVPFQGRNILEKVNELAYQGTAVVITTQCLEEGEDIDVYEVGRNIDQSVVIRAGNMNTEALVPKLMWTLGKTNDIKQVKKWMETPIANDLMV
ncbi:asparaginase [Domibacillus sp. 8LH]|uniref:asparaginase n=1 Tax=Domibacillus sp. 8LH TaxID=3073900 RepID=UPI00317FB09D